jgi:hypothetical protein
MFLTFFFSLVVFLSNFIKISVCVSYVSSVGVGVCELLFVCFSFLLCFECNCLFGFPCPSLLFC